MKKSYEILEKSYEILEEKVTRYLNELELPAGNARMDGDSVNSLTKNCEHKARAFEPEAQSLQFVKKGHGN